MSKRIKLPARYRAGQEVVVEEDDDDLVSSNHPQKKKEVAPQSSSNNVALLSEGVVLKKSANEARVLKKEQQQPAANAQASKKEQEEAAERRRAAAQARQKRDRSSESSSSSSASSDEEAPVKKAPGKITAIESILGKRGKAEESDSESSSAGSSSSSESSSEEEAVPMMRPVFVSKEKRETVKDEAALEAEALLEEQKAKKEEEERIQGSKALLAEKVQESLLASSTLAMRTDAPPKEMVEQWDETEEFEMWKMREFQRIKKEREERQVWAKHLVEIDRRRKMDDEEILAEDGDRSKGEKAKLKFLQRYYHKGAFYQDELEKDYGGVDFTAATGLDADIADKSMLPSVMQVRSKWGLRGRTKYTHLTDQDTTFANRGEYLGPAPKELIERLEKKRGGLGDVTLPTERKKK